MERPDGHEGQDDLPALAALVSFHRFLESLQHFVGDGLGIVWLGTWKLDEESIVVDLGLQLLLDILGRDGDGELQSLILVRVLDQVLDNRWQVEPRESVVLYDWREQSDLLFDGQLVVVHDRSQK